MTYIFMVKIRLSKTGARNAPSYRIVAIDSKRARDSRALENLGVYNPSHNPAVLKIKKDRVKYWQGVGAQTSEAVEKLLTEKYQYTKYEGSVKKEKVPETKTIELPSKEGA
ncbi:MAG: 30S ribosomal protein S16 [bacterium]